MKWIFLIFLLSSNLTVLANDYVNEQKLVCGENQECKPGIVKLISFFNIDGERRPTRCVGTLIGKDIIVTASHCIDQIVKDKKDCRGDIYAQVYQKDKVVTLECEKIISSSRVLYDNLDYPSDYAFIKIDIKEKNLQTDYLLAREELLNNKIFTVTKITNDGNTGVIENIDCLSSFKTYVLPTFKSGKNPRALLSDCFVTAGNSGSPVISNNGQVVGIVDGSNQTESFKSLIELWRSENLLLEEPLPQAIVTNLLCVKFPGEGEVKFPIECRQGYGRDLISYEQNEMIYRNPNVARMKKEMERNLREHMKTLPRYFRYVMVAYHSFERFESYQAIFPECFNNKFRRVLRKNPRGFKLKFENYPFWKTRVGFSKHLRFIALPIQKFSSSYATYNIYPWDRTEVEVDLDIFHDIFKGVEGFEFGVEHCDVVDSDD